MSEGEKVSHFQGGIPFGKVTRVPHPKEFTSVGVQAELHLSELRGLQRYATKIILFRLVSELQFQVNTEIDKNSLLDSELRQATEDRDYWKRQALNYKAELDQNKRD